MTELAAYRTAVDAAWIDYNGHLRDAYYGLIVSLAIDDAMDQLGLDAAYRTRTGCTLYTVETHTHFLHEIKGSDAVTVTTSILDCDRKRIHAGCRLTTARSAEVAATVENMLLHVHQGDTVTSTPLPETVRLQLEALKERNGALGLSPGSRKIELTRR